MLRTRAVRTALIAALTGITGPLVQAQAPGPARPLADINGRPSFDAGSFAYDFVRLGGIVLFVAESRESGMALWRTDGTPAGTAPVKDISAGSYSGGPSGLIAFGGAVYFGSDDGIHGPELWRSDGTEAGTVLVKDIYPGPRGSLLLTEIIVFRGALFFKANDGVHGLELWKSDGTEAGTVLVKDTDPATTSWGGLSSSDIVLAEAAGSLFFTSLDFVHGSELWKTDGTEAGTLLVKDINPGLSSGVPAIYYTPMELNGALYFQATDSIHGQGVWRSDGTEAGTFLVKDVAPGSGYIFEFAKAAGLIFFGVDDEVHGWELWRTDGTEAGTLLARDISPGPTGSYPGNLTEHAGALYFFASEDYESRGLWRSDGTPAGTHKVLPVAAADWLTECHGDLYFANSDGMHGMELWRSDGTAGGTALLKDINPGPSASFYWQTFKSPLTDVDGTLYFIAEDGVHGVEVWTSDGTPGGTVLVKDVNGFNENYGSTPYEMARVGDTLYFSAISTLFSRNLYRTDGTQAGTALVKDFGLGFDPGITSSAVVIGGTMFFPAQDAEHALELWKSEGTDAGTVLVKDINSESFDNGFPSSSRPLSLTVHDGTVFFAADDGLHGYELWKSDGTEAGTVMVKDIDPDGMNHAVLGYFSETRGGLVFGANDGVHGFELWRTDGTEAGTYLLRDINPGRSSAFNSLSVLRPTLDGEAYFTAFEPTHGTELWKSDGTEAGTVLVKDLCPGSCHGLGSLFASETKVVGGNLYFGTIDTRSGGDRHTALWRTDGTEAGTVLVKDFYPGVSQRLTGFFEVGGTLFFRANDGTHGQELWKSDGSEAGTVLVKDITPGGYDPPPSSIGYGSPIVVGETLYFTADDGVHGIELWKSDGTEDGTVLVRDIHPGLDTSQPTQLTEIEGVVLFRADDGIHGVEMWRSDGTEEGTYLVQDIAPGADGSGTFFYSLDPTLLGSRVVFATDDILHGFEPWAGRAAILTGQPLRAIEDIGDELAALDLPGGLVRVLRRHLDLASQALEREGGRQAAIDSMTRFLRKVQALSHRMITDDQRASLVEFAQEIMAFLESASSGGDAERSPHVVGLREGRTVDVTVVVAADGLDPF